MQGDEIKTQECVEFGIHLMLWMVAGGLSILAFTYVMTGFID